MGVAAHDPTVSNLIASIDQPNRWALLSLLIDVPVDRETECELLAGMSAVERLSLRFLETIQAQIQQPQPQKESNHVRTAIYNFIVRVNRSSGLHLCFVVMHSINCAGMGYTSQGTGGTTPMHARGSDDRDMLNRLQRACAGELRRKSPDQIRAARSIRRNLQLVLVGVATLTNTIAGVWENYLMVRSPFRPDCLCAVRAVRVCDRPTS